MTWPAQIADRGRNAFAQNATSLLRKRSIHIALVASPPPTYNHARSRRFPHHGQGYQAHRPREHHRPRRRRPRVSTSLYPPISSPEKKVSTNGETSRYAGARDASPSPHVARSRISMHETDHRIASTSFLHLRGVSRRAAAAGFLALILSTNAAPRRPRPSAAPLSRRRSPSPPTATPAPASASTRPPARSSRTRRRRSSRLTASRPSPASKRQHGDRSGESCMNASPPHASVALFIPVR